MRVFLDTNVLVATAVDEGETGEIAADLLNTDHEFVISLLNLMELRTVLTKKHRLERDRADEIETTVREYTEVVVPDADDILDANALQQETLLYPLDCLIFACAEGCDATLASFDGELLKHGAVEPNELIEDN